MRAKTPSFIAEFPLKTSAGDERALRIRLDAARQVYNAVLGECLRRFALMCESKDWQRARAMPKGAERAALFRAALQRFDFKSSMADRFAIACKNACWIRDHLSSNETQKVALRAFQAVDQHAFGKRGRPRFKRFGNFHSVEGKTNAAGIRFRNGYVEWSGLRMPILLGPGDAWQAEACGGGVVEFSAYRTRLSQFDHLTGEYVKKPLSQRVHVLGDGSGEVQRDLYSAFLARFVDADTLDVRSAALVFPSAKPLLRRAASSEQHEPASGVGFPHPHALRRARAGRSSKRGESGREAGNGVAARRGLRRATADEHRPHLSEPPAFRPWEV